MTNNKTYKYNTCFGNNLRTPKHNTNIVRQTLKIHGYKSLEWNTMKLLNNSSPEEQPLINNSQILIALAYFNTFATLKGGHPWISKNGQQNDQITATNNSLKFK